jgi:hypothetical protein
MLRFEYTNYVISFGGFCSDEFFSSPFSECGCVFKWKDIYENCDKLNELEHIFNFMKRNKATSK